MQPATQTRMKERWVLPVMRRQRYGWWWVLLGLLWVLGAIGMTATAAAAKGKILAVATTAPDLVETYLRNVGETPDTYTLVRTVDELQKAWDQRDQYAVLTFAYHELQNSPAVSAFIRDHADELVAWVKSGGGIVATTRDDPADSVLLAPFGASYSGAGSYNTQTFTIVARNHPIFNLPYVIDTAKMEKEIASAPDPSYVDSGLQPGPDFHTVAVLPGSQDPAIIVGLFGKGKVVFAGAELYWGDYRELPENLHLIANIFAWLRGE